MRKWLVVLSLLPICLPPLPAQAVPLTPSPVAMAPFRVAITVEDLQERLESVEETLNSKEGDREERLKLLDGRLHDLAGGVWRTDEAEIDDALWKRLLEVRNRAAKEGVNPGNWENWKYDRKSVGDKGKYVQAVEQKLYNAFHEIDESRLEACVQAIDELKGVLAKEAFKTDETLKYYLENFAGPAMAGVIHRAGLYRAAMIQNKYRWTLDALKNNDIDGTMLHANDARDYYRGMRGDGFDTKAFKISTNTSDPLADEISVDEAMKQIDEALAKSKALAAKAKAEHEAYLKRWTTLMKADKARIYKDWGIPHRFANWVPKVAPEDAAKSSWWFYFDRQDNYYCWEVTYKFDANHKLIDTQKRLTFSPIY